MAADFALRFPEARRTFEEADEAFGGPLSRWIRKGPGEELRRTEVTQPAILTASLALYRVLAPRLPDEPAFFAGHSLGEYTALVAAGALPFGDAVRLVRRRGVFMQEAVPEGRGAMAAVLGLPAEEVAAICDAIAGVSPANFNSPLQTVIAGEAAAVAEASERLRTAGAKRVRPLDVSAPFHCPLMKPAAERLAHALGEAPLEDPRVPVLSNVSARPYRTAAEARELLREQVCAPVRWSDTVKTLVAEGTRIQLEVGPGNVLTGLAARIDRGLARVHVARVEDLEPALERVREVLA